MNLKKSNREIDRHQTTCHCVAQLDSSSLGIPRDAREASKRSLLCVNEHCEQTCNKAETKNAKSIVEIFTDGACRGNPGLGGWGVLMRYGTHEKHLYGAEKLTTNNRMELTAVIKGLNALKKSCVVHLTTDSQYVHKGVTEWLAKWQQNGWKNKKKDAIKNLDLWQELITAKERHQIKWHWIKGHSGHRENEIADLLANQAIDEMLMRR